MINRSLNDQQTAKMNHEANKKGSIQLEKKSDPSAAMKLVRAENSRPQPSKQSVAAVSGKIVTAYRRKIKRRLSVPPQNKAERGEGNFRSLFLYFSRYPSRGRLGAFCPRGDLDGRTAFFPQAQFSHRPSFPTDPGCSRVSTDAALGRPRPTVSCPRCLGHRNSPLLVTLSHFETTR